MANAELSANGDDRLDLQITDRGSYKYFSVSLYDDDGNCVKSATDYDTKWIYSFYNLSAGTYSSYVSCRVTASGSTKTIYSNKVTLGGSGGGDDPEKPTYTSDAYISIQEVTADSVVVTVEDIDTCNFDVYMVIVSISDSTVDEAKFKNFGSTIEYTFSNLTPETYYTITAEFFIDATHHTLEYSCDASVTTLKSRNPSAKLTASGNTLTVTIANKGDYTKFNASIWDHDSGTRVTESTPYSTNDTIVFDGSVYGFKYNYEYFAYVGCKSDAGSLTIYTMPVYTDSPPPIEPWTWTGSNGDASASQTSTAHSAVLDKGKTSSFSYLVWNDLVNKVNEALIYDGKTWTSDPISYAAALMSPSDTILTADKFNAVNNNIKRGYNTNVGSVNKGDEVLGSYFTKMTSALNSWIDTL